MPEEQAFCVLVKIMFDYGLRDLFKQGFEELHLKFYQIQRFMHVSTMNYLITILGEILCSGLKIIFKCGSVNMNTF